MVEYEIPSPGKIAAPGMKFPTACHLPETPKWLAPFIELALITEWSPAVALQLEWSDIDLENAKVTLRAQLGLTLNDLQVSLTPRAVEIISALPRNGGRLFPNPIPYPVTQIQLDVAFGRVGLLGPRASGIYTTDDILMTPGGLGTPVQHRVKNLPVGVCPCDPMTDQPNRYLRTEQ